jgi:hypothetical protein
LFKKINLILFLFGKKLKRVQMDESGPNERRKSKRVKGGVVAIVATPESPKVAQSKRGRGRPKVSGKNGTQQNTQVVFAPKRRGRLPLASGALNF